MDDSKREDYAQRMRAVFDYISQNLDEEFDLDKLSAIACFSKYHFHRQFSDYTGIGVFKYVQMMRLKRASYRLAFNKDKRIIEIALDAQFENPESFSRAFKLHIGQTPSGFRKHPDWSTWHTLFRFPKPFIAGAKKMDVKIVDFDETRIAYLEHRAAPERVLETANQFIEWRKDSKLSPVESSKTFGIVYDNPEITPPDEFRFDIAGTVEGEVPPNAQGVKTGAIPGGRCAVVRHVGSHDNIGDAVRYLYGKWLPESGEELRDYPVFFHYLNLIPFVDEHELLTDVYLPLM
jgi:AraC family transcriptional regulator